MSLLRQWQLLEILMTSLGGIRPAARLVVWNLDHIDSAVAVAVAHLHLLAGSAGLVVYHSGIVPCRRPLDWPRSELRGMPRNPWMRTVEGKRGRLAPHRRVLESVILAPPPGQVNLLIAGGPNPTGRPDLDGSLARLRKGGYLLCPDGPVQCRLTLAGFEPVGGSGQIFRKLTPCEFPDGATGPAGPTLADCHDQAVLIDSHTNLARSIARRFAGRGERTEDLEQVAYLALVRAASRFDPRMGRPFSAFATPSIAGELKRHFRDKLWTVRVPRSVQERYLALRDAREELTQRHGSSPTISQIASYLDITDEELLGAMEASTNSWATSLDRPSGDEGDRTEIPVADEGFDRSLDRALLMKSIERLSPTEQLVLKRVYFEEKTQREVAAELGVSQMQISRLMTRILARMRESFEAA